MPSRHCPRAVRSRSFAIAGGAPSTGPRTPVLVTAVVLAALGSVSIANAGDAVDAAGGTYRWLDADGQPLPFQDAASIREALQEADVLSREKIGRGVAGAEKLVLEHDGVRFHAALRTVNITKVSPSAGSIERSSEYRDAAVFELAAYELSEMLGLHRVPPVVVRTVGDDSGTVQMWLEDTMPEDELILRNDLDPPDVGFWNRQKQVMFVFDSLIGNSDRNQGNLLIDRGWNIWLIDHTRAFRRTSVLLYRDTMVACDRQLWRRLQELDPAQIRARLEPYLERQELAKVVLRHKKLVRHFEELIEKRGEAMVLFDLERAPVETTRFLD